MINDCFGLFEDMLRFTSSKKMDIFNEFKNFELPQDYKYHDNITYYDDINFTLLENLSKHNDIGIWNHSLTCQNYLNDHQNFNLSDLGLYFESNGTITRWISYHIHQGYNIFDTTSKLF